MKATPDSVLALIKEAEQYYARGALQASAAAYRAALKLAPTHATVLHNLAILELQSGNRDEAERLFRSLHKHYPDSAVANLSLGRLLLAADQIDEALPLLLAAAQLMPHSPQATYSVGSVLQRKGDAAAAVVWLERALRADPRLIDAVIGLVDAHLELGKSEAALQVCDEGLRLSPDEPRVLYKKAFVLAHRADYEQADQLTRAVLKRFPNYAPAYNNLAALAAARLDWGQASDDYRRALQLDPELLEAKVGLAQALLGEGKFAEGWQQYEHRPHGIFSLRPPPGGPRVWKGEVFSGTLVVIAEMGLGDTLQFARLIPFARARVDQLYIYITEYHRPIKRLLATIDGVDGVVEDTRFLAQSQAIVFVMSLPHLIGGNLDRPPTPVPYLRVDAQSTERWRERVSVYPRPRVGLVWSGNPRRDQPLVARSMDGRRSLSAEVLAPLLAVPDVSFFSLQVGESGVEGLPAALKAQIEDCSSKLTDMMETAGLVSALDLVVTVDTSVAHLAGALGKSVWMLNRSDSCWRWGIEGSSAPWYPTMIIWRQSVPGHWEPVIAEVAARLRAFASAKPDP